MSLEPGTRLGHYEVLAPIGPELEGRYKASDTRHNRLVALKLLPPQISEQPEAKQRLARDARTISSLNHPHISAPIDVGHQDPSTDFIVTEYVEGETLAARLARGPLDLPEAMTVAIAIADSLDKAHRLGITHGSLNPSNVILAPGGPKLLDFGLARLTQETGASVSMSMATTRRSIASLSELPTSTAPYLAPEQYAGSQADARSDIFALGTILYEMVTGRRAFEEKTQALLIAAVQSVDPEPVSKVQPAAPPALEYVIHRCLGKDPGQRFQTALDLESELQWIAKGGVTVGKSAPLAVRWWKREAVVWSALATAALLAVGLAASALSTSRGVSNPEEARFLVSTLPLTNTPIALSPDGRWLIGAVSNGPVIGLSLDSVTPQTLISAETGTPYQPFWSSDSRSVAYFEDGKLKRADLGGGPPQIICDAPTGYSAGAWNGDGVILFPAGGLIQRVLAAGGQAAPITALDQSKQEIEHLGPAFLPDGRHFLFLAVSSQPAESAIYVGSLDSSERVRLFASESKAVFATTGSGQTGPGYLLFNRGNTVFAQGFDADTRTLTGEPIRVASGVPLRIAQTGTSAAITRSANFAVSQTGVLAYRTGGPADAPAAASNDEQRSLVWVDRSGQRSAPLGTTGGYAGVDLAPDGKRFAVHRHEGTGGDNWIFDLAEGRMQRLTFDTDQHNSNPIWSPDGTRIAFASRRNNKWGVYVKLADGTATEELITESEVLKMPSSWSPDGKLLVYTQATGVVDVWAVPVTGEKKPFPLLQGPYTEVSPQVSPDGKWLAYSSNETGRNEIFVKSFPEGAGKWQVSTDGGNFLRWRGDGRELYYHFGNTMYAVDIRVSGSSLTAGVPRILYGLGGINPSGDSFYNRFAVTSDGQRFLVSQPAAAGLVNSGGLADQIAAAADQGGVASGGTYAVTVVLNWHQMLKQK
jgi:serine/threonine protein kinase/Tol biopolymer transport system component